MIYIILIIIDLTLIATINAILGAIGVINMTIDYAIIATLVDFAIMIGIEAIIALIIHKLPDKLFSPYNRVFKVFKWERGFLEWTRIRKWKEWVPDTGQLCDFKKNELKGTDTEYIYKFLVESCYADCIHFWMAFGGFLIMVVNITNVTAMLTICLPMAIISFFLNLLPMLIQRYNRPKLLKVYERNIRLEKTRETTEKGSLKF